MCNYKMDSEHVDMLLRIIKAVKSVYDILNSHCVTTSGLPSDSIIQLLSLCTTLWTPNDTKWTLNMLTYCWEL